MSESRDEGRPVALIVDDEVRLVSVVSYALQAAGIQPVPAFDGKQALVAARNHAIDIAVVDVGLPDTTGFKLCLAIKELRDVPVVFLTVRADQADVIEGLRVGADDYITKPFSTEELVLRVKAILRRHRPEPTTIAVGSLLIDTSTHRAAVDDQVLPLTPLEFRLLQYLAVHCDRVVPVTELVREVWGVAASLPHDPLVKTTVYRIRHKMQPGTGVEIRNIRGVGYQLEAGAP